MTQQDNNDSDKLKIEMEKLPDDIKKRMGDDIKKWITELIENIMKCIIQEEIHKKTLSPRK